MHRILLLFCLALFVGLPVQASPVTIPGIGEINPGQNITVTEAPDKKGAINYMLSKSRTDRFGTALY